MNNYDPQKPYNQIPLLPPNFNFDQVEILKLVNKANIALSELKGMAHTLPNRYVILEPFAVKEAVASNGVENINTSVSEVFQAEVLPKGESSVASKETLYYKSALMKALKIYNEKKFLSTNDYIQIQSILEPKKDGIRKISQVTEPVKIVDTLTNTTVYTPPEGEELIRRLLKNFEDFFNINSDNLKEIDPLIKLAIMHYQFEAIHPFRDGNGRTGRILMVMYLVLTNRLDLPILFISGYILRNKSEYYKKIKDVTENQNWKDWVIYILNAVIIQSNETKNSILQIKALIISYKKKAKEKSLPDSSDFIDYLFARPFYTYNDLSKRTSCHLNTSRKYLNLLYDNNILKRMKVGKEFVFYNPDFLKLLEA